MTQARRVPFLSLRVRLAVSILVGVALSMATLYLPLMVTMREQMLGRLLSEVSLTARSVERVIAMARERTAGLDTVPAGQLFERALILNAGREEVLGALLLRSDGGVAGRYGNGFDLPPGDWREGPGGVRYHLDAGPPPRIIVKAPVRTPEGLLDLYVDYSLASANRLLAAVQTQSLLQMVAATLLIFVFLFVVLTVMVIRPLGALRAATERVAGGKLDGRVNLTSNDEMGLLADSLNDMVATLRGNRETIDRQFEEMRRANRDLVEAHGRVIAAEKMASLGTLAAGVAHEVGNPLQAAVGYLSLLRADDLQPGERDDYLRRAAADLDRIRRIMQELLSYVRPTAEPSVPIDLAATLGRLVETLRHDGTLGHLEVSLSVATGLPRPTGSVHRLEQVFINLVTNAVRATAPEGKLAIAAVPRPGPGGCGARIVFADDGAGIAPEHLERIFDPFFSSRRNEGGVGLGLAISRRIVGEMGGTLTAANGPTGGAVFTLDLPADPGAVDGL
jgi:signal transduction histidine kinase